MAYSHTIYYKAVRCCDTLKQSLSINIFLAWFPSYMQGTETAQFRCSALARWCPLDLTPPETSPAIHPKVCHGRRCSVHPGAHQVPHQSPTRLTGWEETCPVGNKHTVQQLVFLILQDRDGSLRTAQVTAGSCGGFHTPGWTSALLCPAGSSSHSTAVFAAASFQRQAGVGMTTHSKKQRDLISQSPSLTSF